MKTGHFPCRISAKQPRDGFTPLLFGACCIALAALTLSACQGVPAGDWQGGPDEYLQTYPGPKLGTDQVARIRVKAEKTYIYAAPTARATAVDGTSIPLTKRLDTLPGRHEIAVSYFHCGMVTNLHCWKDASGSVSVELEAGHEYEFQGIVEGLFDLHFYMTVIDTASGEVLVSKKELEEDE